MDYKEYSRLRSIARKRIESASAAGVGAYTRIPTVAEVRASANPAEYMNAVKRFLASDASTLTAARKAGTALSQISFTPLPPATRKSKYPTEEARRAARNKQKRFSKAKRALEKAAATPEEATQHAALLKALRTVTEDWLEQGVDIAHWISSLSPGQAKSFVAYMEYRFAQGDYKNRYTIDTFIRDFGELVKRQYNFKDIESDFSKFLEKEKSLKKNQKKTAKYGVTNDIVDSAWRKMIKAQKPEKKAGS